MNTDRTEPNDRAHATDARNPGSKPRASVILSQLLRGCRLSAQRKSTENVEAGRLAIGFVYVHVHPETASQKKVLGAFSARLNNSHSPSAP